MIDNSNIFGVNVHKTKKFKSFVFDNRNFSIQDLIMQIEELNKNKVDKNFKNRLFFECYNSNRIEGNTLSRHDTKLLWDYKVIPSDSNYNDIVECLNLKATINKYRKIDVNKVSLDLIKDIHSMIVSNLNVNSDFREEQVYISYCLHIPPNADKVIDLMNRAVDRFNSSNKNLVDVFMLKLDLVTIHPFMDGNGRTSRLLMNGLLEYLGYPRLIFKDADKKFYYKALEDAQVKYKVDNWIRYCLILMKYNLVYLNDIDILD